MAERIPDHPIFGERQYPRFEVKIGVSSLVMRGLERYLREGTDWNKTSKLLDQDMTQGNIDTVMPEYFIPDISFNQSERVKKEIAAQNIQILFGDIQKRAENKRLKVICVDTAHGPFFSAAQFVEFFAAPMILALAEGLLSFKFQSKEISLLLIPAVFIGYLQLAENMMQYYNTTSFREGKLDELVQKFPLTTKFGMHDARNVVRARAIQTILSEDKEPKRYYMPTAIYHLLATHYYLTHPNELAWKWALYKRMPYIEKKARYYEFGETDQGNKWVKTETRKIR